MASVSVQSRSAAQAKVEGYPADSLRFDLWSVAFSLWFMVGLFLDGWAHNHIAELETFFTPWHGVLYTGYFAVAGLMAFTQYRNVSRGYAFSRALPRGYFLSLVGVVIFFIGGGGDMLWHTLFGIEQNVEALFSPTHLMLATGAILFLSGPLRAAWLRAQAEGWRELLPAIISLGMLFSFFTFFTQYSNIFGNPGVLIGEAPTSNPYFINTTGVSYLLYPSAIMMGVALFALRRWRLPLGTFTFLFTVNAVAMLLMRFKFASPYALVIGAAFAAGVIADLLNLYWRPSVERPNMLRLFAFTVPFVFVLLVFVALNLTNSGGLWWAIHMWLGVPFIAGAVGLGLSFLAAPPAIPTES